MSGAEGIILGIVATLIAVAFCWLVRQSYDDGDPKFRYLATRLWYRVKFKTVLFDCISCGGEGERVVSGSLAPGVPGPDVLEECMYCDGTGKEKVGYGYRALFRFVHRNDSLADLERAQRDAELVLGPARWRMDGELDKMLRGK